MKKISSILALALFVSANFLLSAREEDSLEELVNRLNAKEPLRSAVWGVLAVRANGDTLVNFNSSRKMIPASNTKLITTGAALFNLGGDFRFETTLAYDGVVTDSTLTGDLYILGGGDPTIAADDRISYSLDSTFGTWLEMLRKAGIKNLRGRIIGDGRYFDGDKSNSLWMVDDLGYNYGAGFDALSFYENTQLFKIAPGKEEGDPILWKPEYPELPWMKYESVARTSRRGSGNSVRYIIGDDAPRGIIAGKLALGRAPSTQFYTNSFGAYTCAYMFGLHAKERAFTTDDYACADIDGRGFVRTTIGVHGTDSSQLAKQVSELTKIGVWKSPPLREIVWQTNKMSDNLYAETLLRMMGKKGKDSAGIDSSLAVLGNVLEKMGARTELGYHQTDGSGLSRETYISPEFFVDYLGIVAESPVYADFIESLPAPGGYGTLEPRLPNCPEIIRSRIRAKSGTMGGVRCYTGYIIPSTKGCCPAERKIFRLSPDTIIFSVMTNNAANSLAVLRALDEIMEALARRN